MSDAQSTAPPMTRANLPAGEVLCKYCTAKCCRYFALPIDTPTTWHDFDNLRWYLAHGRCAIFVESQPLLQSTLAYRIVDAHSGQLAAGRLDVRELCRRQPWEAP